MQLSFSYKLARLKHRAQLSCCSKLAPNHTAQLSFCFKLVRIVRKLKLVRNCMHNCPFNQNWCLFLKAKSCEKHRAQYSCCSKFASKHSSQPSFCFKLARIVRKPKPVKNAVHNFPVARNWPQITLCNCRFRLKWATFLKKLKLVQNTVRNCPAARNFRQSTLRNCRFALN